MLLALMVISLVAAKEMYYELPITLDINLDLPPRERQVHVGKHFSEEIRRMENDFSSYLPFEELFAIID